MVVSPSWCELTCIDSMVWGKIVRVIRVEIWEIYQERCGVQRPTLHADRYYGGAGAGSQEFMTFRINTA